MPVQWHWTFDANQSATHRCAFACCSTSDPGVANGNAKLHKQVGRTRASREKCRYEDRVGCQTRPSVWHGAWRFENELVIGFARIKKLQEQIT
jgi:hypothetical protein